MKFLEQEECRVMPGFYSNIQPEGVRTTEVPDTRNAGPIRHFDRKKKTKRKCEAQNAKKKIPNEAI